MNKDLVTLEQVKIGLREQSNDDDALLSALISGASGSIINYLKSAAKHFLDEDGNVDPDKVPAEVKSATITLVGILFRNPDHDPDGAFTQGRLPFMVTSLIYQLRDPTLA